jgi:GT2 family glycosyltransferase
MYAEDLDLGWRLRQAGWTARYLPNAIVYHAESASTTQAWGDGRHDRWHASTYAWLIRRRRPSVARLIALINVGGYFLRALIFTPAALAGSEASKQARGDALATSRAHMIGLRPRQALERNP